METNFEGLYSSLNVREITSNSGRTLNNLSYAQSPRGNMFSRLFR